VVFDVKIHVQIQKTEDRVHHYRAGIEPMIEHILLKARMLRNSKEHNKPTTQERRPTNEHNWDGATQYDSCDHRDQQDPNHDSRFKNYPAPFMSRDQFFCFIIKPPAGVTNEPK